MTLINAHSSFCSSRSRTAEEALYGTGGQYGVFLLAEFNQPLEPKVENQFAHRAFPQAADRQRWQALLDSLPTPRLQTLRQRGYSTDNDGLTFFVAIPREHNPLLYEFRLQDYTEILDLDMAELLAGSLDYRRYLSEDPLFLVCTHGRRDPCCARHGLPAYQHLARYIGKPTVWQSSHLGGHRFAATMIAFPHGIYSGRVWPENTITQVAQRYLDGHLDLDHYRGRACYSKAQSAAEYFLRRETGITDLDAFRLLPTPEGSLTLRFEHLAGKQQHEITLRRELPQWAIPTSCSEENAESVPYYALEKHTIVAQG